MKTLGLLILLAGLAGCKTQEERDAELATVYRTGMSREDLRKIQWGDPIASEDRPEGGWPADPRGQYDLHSFVRAHERHHSVEVRTCDVYWVPRNSLGIYWDYVYFDADGKLVGFRRRFVD